MNPIRLTDEEKLLFEPAKYSIFEIANWFLLKESMTHKKLQKLCYYAQAWFYALRDIRLSDATFEAWVHGPVSPALYDKFKPFGYSAIKLASEYSTAVLPEDADLLESVWVTYGDRTGNALEALSHNETPWIEARLGYESDERCEVVISPGSMKKYYRSIYLDGDTQ
jgi:uncharacterized phage-associated protein